MFPTFRGHYISMIRILLADDRDVMRRGPRDLLEADHPDWMVCAEAANGREAVVLALQTQPDVAILDLSSPS